MADRSHDIQTLSYVLEKLRKQSNDKEFVMEGEYFASPDGKKYTPEDLLIIKTFRFEGETDPGDSSILYIIETNDGVLGYSMDAYGVYSNHDASYNDFIRSIQVEDRDDQLIFTLKEEEV